MRLPINEGKNRIFAKQADIFYWGEIKKKKREREGAFSSQIGCGLRFL